MAAGFVLYAKNVHRVAGFYQATLGLQVLEQESSHTLLSGPGLSLVIHALPEPVAADLHIAQPPALREHSPVKPIFMVADLGAVRAAAQASGGGLKPEAAAWPYRGATVLDGWDPEGNVVQFQQPGSSASGPGPG